MNISRHQGNLVYAIINKIGSDQMVQLEHNYFKNKFTLRWFWLFLIFAGFLQVRFFGTIQQKFRDVENFFRYVSIFCLKSCGVMPRRAQYFAPRNSKKPKPTQSELFLTIIVLQSQLKSECASQFFLIKTEILQLKLRICS